MAKKKADSAIWLLAAEVLLALLLMFGTPELSRFMMGRTRASTADPARMIFVPVFDWIREVVADPLALFTLVLAASTIMLWRSTRQLWKSSERQFAIAQRPRLRVRNVVVNERDWNAEMARGTLVTGQFYIANVGTTEARDVRAHCEFHASNIPWLPMRRPYEGKEPMLIVDKLPPGASVPFPFGEMMPGDPEVLAEIGWQAYFLGFVEYADRLGTVRRTAFCRCWNSGRRRFYQIEDDPDYEHEE